MNNSAFTIKPRRNAVSTTAAVLFFILAILALWGIIVLILAYREAFDELVKELEKNLTNPDSYIKTYKSQLNKSIFALVALNSPVVFAYALAGLSLMLEKDRLCTLSFLIQTVMLLINTIINMKTSAYESFFYLACDLIVVACMWLIFSMLFDSTKIRMSYTPPKKRYVVFPVYVVFSLITLFSSSTLASDEVDGSVKFGAFIAEVMILVATFLTMKYMLVEDLPISEQVEEQTEQTDSGYFDRLSSIKPIKKNAINKKEELEKYRMMYINGALSKKEYEIKKKELE